MNIIMYNIYTKESREKIKEEEMEQKRRSGTKTKERKRQGGGNRKWWRAREYSSLQPTGCDMWGRGGGGVCVCVCGGCVGACICTCVRVHCLFIT